MSSLQIPPKEVVGKSSGVLVFRAMENGQFSWEAFDKAPVVGIARGWDGNILLEVADTYFDVGFHTLEVTMNTPKAPELIRRLRERFPDRNIGAGTVCDGDDLQRALDAGSQFIVTPILDETVVQKAVANQISIFPGAFSPTEIYRAWSLGASAVKVFPATQLGHGFLKDILAPLDMLKLVPTGGISATNMEAFFRAGAFGVGMGGSLFPEKLLQAKDFKGLTDHLKNIKQQLEASLPLRTFSAPSEGGGNPKKSKL